MNTALPIDTRPAVLRWFAALAELARTAPATRAPSALESRSIALAKSALRAARALTPSAAAIERADLLILALGNARTAAVCLLFARRAARPSDQAIEERSEPSVSAIVSRSVEGDLDTEPGQLRDELELLFAHSQSLLVELELPARRALDARRRAWLRVLAPLLGLAVALAVAGWEHFRARELAAGKPWTTSSVAATCDPVHQLCGGTKTSILFHTQEDAEPWFEIDLGAVHELKRVELKNRRDCCQERAVPLVVEVSLDHQHYQMVARKFATFEQWGQSFPVTRARYVRLRVARRASQLPTSRASASLRQSALRLGTRQPKQ